MELESDLVRENYKIIGSEEVNEIDIVILDAENTTINEVVLLDVSGKVIDMTMNTTKEKVTLRNFEVTPGIYYIKIVSESGALETHKLFID
jgi:hypothetical protein